MDGSAAHTDLWDVTRLCLLISLYHRVMPATAHVCLYGDMEPSEILDRNMLLGAYCNKTFPLMSALCLPSRKLSMTLLHTHHSLTKRVWVPRCFKVLRSPRLITSDRHPKQQWRGHAPRSPSHSRQARGVCGVESAAY